MTYRSDGPGVYSLSYCIILVLIHVYIWNTCRYNKSFTYLLTYYTVSFLYTIWIESTFPLFSGFTLVVFFHHTLCCLFMRFFFYIMRYFSTRCAIYVNPHDLLRPYGCAMSFIMFHVFDCFTYMTCCLKTFSMSLQNGFFVCFYNGKGGGWILVHKWGSGLYCFLYAILMYNLSVSVLSNWVKWCFNVHSNFFVHLYWLLWSWMHVYGIEIDISIIY